MATKNTNHPREHPTTLRKLLASPSLSRPKDWWRAQCAWHDAAAPERATIKALREALENAMRAGAGGGGTDRDGGGVLKGVAGGRVVKRGKAGREKGEEKENPKVKAEKKRVVRTVVPPKAPAAVRRSSRRAPDSAPPPPDEEAMDFEMEYETEYREQIKKLNSEGKVDEGVRRRRESLFWG